MPNPIDVTVVYKHDGARRVLSKIRQWSHTVSQPAYKDSLNISKENNLSSAFQKTYSRSRAGILITIGFSESELNHHFRMAGRKDEIIVRPPRPCLQNNEIDEFPSASLLGPLLPIVHVQNTIPALKKSILRIRTKENYRIGMIENEEDFKQYFSLRYRVWESLGYIAPENKSTTSKWEVNFSDRSAVPIGCFLNSGELIGTARLVFPQGREARFAPLIKRMIMQKDDPVLQSSFEYPERMMHPFDVLYSFSGFQRFYARLRQQRIHKAEVSRIIVAPEHRNRGLGQVLVDSLKSLARQRGLSLFFLACLEKHAPFYQRCGFDILEGEGMRCEKFIGVNVPAVAMAQKLTTDLRNRPI